MLADQVNVKGNQEGGDRRQQQNVQSKESGKGDHTNAVFPSQQSRYVGTQQRCLAGNPRRDHRSPVGAVIPRQQISSESIGQGQKQQGNAHAPTGFPRLFVSTIIMLATQWWRPRIKAPPVSSVTMYFKLL